MSKLIVVFGATGNQGGSVIEALLAEGNYKIRAVTRNPQSARAQKLASKGVEVVQADYSNKGSLVLVLTGAYGAFVVLSTDFCNPDCQRIETEQGKTIADALYQSGTKHVVFSSQLNVLKIIGVNARHMVAKAEVEEYMKSIGVPVSSLIVPFYMENLFEGMYKPQKTDDGTYWLTIPMGTIPLDVISVRDIGTVVHQIFNNPGQIGKTLNISGDKLTVKDMAHSLSRHLYPKQFKDKQLTTSQFLKLGWPGANDSSVMFEFFQRVDQRTSVALTKKLNPDTKSFDEWVIANKAKLMEIL